MEVKKVLCAVDLEDTIAPSVEYAKMMASMTGASILVAYVIPAHTPYEMCIFPSTTSRMK